ncbi:terminase small subunit [Bacillus altitudinis]|uniref:Terminase small subunit n=1 Tax=Bacillus altitudinis TaxID=293387 RepID=A0A653P987_BACAB|nr:terminase small subunit [Bacillus altitudinis]MDN0041492.1 terminase small subunit [Bacillus aerophilus]MCM3063201.1 terminase small subunit [Bacillus altitudinis]MCM3075905.1 terminase small subunit [Bacillus altitudinis]MCY7452852.1 terminase small subunit [Bacillus altitudinis]MDM5166299.1 terminase small subunit [Bacillus altitudinis]
MKLTEKQKRFADYYIELGNATEAARKAGYSSKTAKSIGQENLTKPDIKSYIKERLNEKDAERIASQDEILEFLTAVMRGEKTEQIPVGLGEGAQQLEDKDPYLKDRVKAAELLGKRHSMWTDKVDMMGNVGVRIVDDIGDDDDHD